MQRHQVRKLLEALLANLVALHEREIDSLRN